MTKKSDFRNLVLFALLLFGAAIYAARIVPNSPPNSADWRLAILAISTCALAAAVVASAVFKAPRVGSLLSGAILLGVLGLGIVQNAIQLPHALKTQRYSAHLQPALDLASIAQAAPLPRENADRALYLTMADHYRGCHVRLPSNSILDRSKLAFWAQITSVRTDPDIEPLTLPRSYTNDVFEIARGGRIHMPLAYQTAAVPSPCMVTAHPIAGEPETHLLLRVTVGTP